MVLNDGDPEAAQALLDGDDEIDRMHTSLTEQCYELLAREQPMASDLRLVVSVIRALDSLERIGDLCLRIANTVEDQGLLAAHPGVHAVLDQLSNHVIAQFHAMEKAWALRSTEPLNQSPGEESLNDFGGPLMERILELQGPDAVRVAMAAFVSGRSLDRIGDHTQIMEHRLRYLLTGDTKFLAEEVG